MKKQPLLSVVVPVYNAEPYIARCLNSIIGQSYEKLEIICVDDGSIDRSGASIDEFAQRDSRIKAFHKKNGGVVSSRKLGSSVATGEYIACVDSDDWIEPNMFRDVISLAVCHDADVVTTQEIRDYGNYVINTRSTFREGLYISDELTKMKENLIDQNLFFKPNISGHLCDKIFRATKYKEAQMAIPDGITIGEDPAVCYPILMSSKRVYIMDKNYYHYCLRPDSLMGRESVYNPKASKLYCDYLNEVLLMHSDSVKNIHKQVELLCMYDRLFRNIEDIVRYDGNMLFPYGHVSEDERVAIYGAGKFGINLHGLFKKRGWFKNIEWYDTNGKNGAKIIDTNLGKNDKVIVGALQFDAIQGIKKVLKEWGIPEDKILTINPSIGDDYE